MSGYRPKPSPGGVTPSRIPPAGGGGVARPNDARGLRAVPRITAVVHVGRREVARFGDRGDLIAASSRFWDTLRSEDPDTIEVWLAPDVSDATRDRVTDVLRDAEQHAQRRREAEREAVDEVAAAAVMDVDTAERFDAHLMGAGVLYDPNAHARRARIGEPEQVDLMLRIFRALVAFMVAVPRVIREHPRTYFAVGVPVILIGTGQVGHWVGGIDWPVVIVSTLIVLAGVFVVALSVSRRNYRREIEAERAALAERAQKQYEEWLKE
ncbi:hypothetical protein SEA_GALADRIEL_7 [Gordonia phage Galadriel]|uniref:Membrane protein n=2 Tax=Vividuovirus TaxID=2560251 RepID=A0A7G8LDT7_9CAUD|nr:hypothetical protein KNU61_gp07 [Gordonia phage Galadriel]YP_010109460.1 membrane protein [Gordonia phage Paries]QDH92026.1 hypothetical protein SEA_GALADRIEL_7 [Gordonia phage Galadriel]QNJ55409.1 membrane protein [Gordonia phage Paries]